MRLLRSLVSCIRLPYFGVEVERGGKELAVSLLTCLSGLMKGSPGSMTFVRRRIVQCLWQIEEQSAWIITTKVRRTSFF